MNTNFKYATLSEESINFLKNYKPSHRSYTTYEEVDLINTTLGIKDSDDVEYIRSVRNSVVKLYHELNESIYDGDKILDHDKFEQYMNGLMSVTASIDELMYCTSKMID